MGNSSCCDVSMNQNLRETFQAHYLNHAVLDTKVGQTKCYRKVYLIKYRTDLCNSVPYLHHANRMHLVTVCAWHILKSIYLICPIIFCHWRLVMPQNCDQRRNSASVSKGFSLFFRKQSVEDSVTKGACQTVTHNPIYCYWEQGLTLDFQLLKWESLLQRK